MTITFFPITFQAIRDLMDRKVIGKNVIVI